MLSVYCWTTTTTAFTAVIRERRARTAKNDEGTFSSANWSPKSADSSSVFCSFLFCFVFFFFFLSSSSSSFFFFFFSAHLSFSPRSSSSSSSSLLFFFLDHHQHLLLLFFLPLRIFFFFSLSLLRCCFLGPFPVQWRKSEQNLRLADFRAEFIYHQFDFL